MDPAVGMVIVEFFGMPGSGKTYLAEKLSTVLKGKGLRISDRSLSLAKTNFITRMSVKLALVLWCMPGNIGAVRAIMSAVMAYKPAGLVKSVKLTYNWLYLLALIQSESRQHDVIVLDQGLGQAIWSMLFHGHGRPDAKPEGNLFTTILGILRPSSVGIIHVHASHDLIRRRVCERANGRSPLDREMQASWRRAVSVSEESMVLLEQLSAILPYLRIFDIDNDNDRDDVNALDDLVAKMGIG